MRRLSEVMDEQWQLVAGTETCDAWGKNMGRCCRKPGVAGDGADVSAGQQEPHTDVRTWADVSSDQAGLHAQAGQ